MNIKKENTSIFDRLNINFLILALAGSLLSSYGGPLAADSKGTDPAVADIIVSFKLDPRLTRSLYMGDRWVSPPTYTSTLQVGKQAIVEARVMGRDARGRSLAISPDWIAADPDMVAVSPGQGSVVTITAKRAGKSRLDVVWQGVTKELHVETLDKGNAVQVVISK